MLARNQIRLIQGCKSGDSKGSPCLGVVGTDTAPELGGQVPLLEPLVHSDHLVAEQLRLARRLGRALQQLRQAAHQHAEEQDAWPTILRLIYIYIYEILFLGCREKTHLICFSNLCYSMRFSFRINCSLIQAFQQLKECPFINGIVPLNFHLGTHQLHFANKESI